MSKKVFEPTIYDPSLRRAPAYRNLKKSEFLLSDGEVVASKPRRQTRSRHLRPILINDDQPDMCKQSFMQECDINHIMKRFETTGQLPDMIKTQPSYGDFTNVPKFEDAMQTIIHAQDQFAALSSKIRGQFDNDPKQFLAFVNDPKNSDELVRMGLATKKPTPKEPEPQKVIVVTPPEPKGDSKK